MKIIYLFLAVLFPSTIFGQNGTSGSPFTSLGHAWNVSSSGIYYFNIGGTAFSTYVESGNGWVLIASGNSATAETSYPVISNLTLQSDKILPSSIYASALITAVRMNATAGPTTPFDVQSSHSTIITNLRSNRTLSVSSTTAMWTGTGTARLHLGCGTSNTTLNNGIYHSGCSATNLHWAVSQSSNFEKVDHNSASKNNLNLWIRATSVALPVELNNFMATLINNSYVQLDWQTSSEVNNDYFIIQRSKDGVNWEALSSVKGSENSSAIINYQTNDDSPQSGVSYYRLKQTDLDGQFNYSTIQSVDIKEELLPVLIYPNPVLNHLVIEADQQELDEVTVYNFIGDDVTEMVEITVETESLVKIDVSKLIPGVYIVKMKTTARSIYKE